MTCCGHHMAIIAACQNCRALDVCFKGDCQWVSDAGSSAWEGAHGLLVDHGLDRLLRLEAAAVFHVLAGVVIRVFGVAAILLHIQAAAPVVLPASAALLWLAQAPIAARSASCCPSLAALACIQLSNELVIRRGSLKSRIGAADWSVCLLCLSCRRSLALSSEDCALPRRTVGCSSLWLLVRTS